MELLIDFFLALVLVLVLVGSTKAKSDGWNSRKRGWWCKLVNVYLYCVQGRNWEQFVGGSCVI